MIAATRITRRLPLSTALYSGAASAGAPWAGAVCSTPSIKLRDDDARAGFDDADLGAERAAFGQLRAQRRRRFGSNRDQQTAGGLRVAEDQPCVGRYLPSELGELL